MGSQLLEYIYVLLSLGPFMFSMHVITTSIPSPTLGPSVDHGVGMAGTKTPYVAHIFRSGHIPPSTPFVGGFSLPSPGLNTSIHSHRGGSGYVNVGYQPYIPSYVPSPTALFFFNAVVMINPPYILYIGIFTDCFKLFWRNNIFM